MKEVEFAAKNSLLTIKGILKDEDDFGTIELCKATIYADKKTIAIIDKVSDNSLYYNCSTQEQANHKASVYLEKSWNKILCVDNKTYIYNNIEYQLDMYDIFKSEFIFSKKV